MIRAGRVAVELLLWLGVAAGLSLLLVWWDVRPGAGADHVPEVGDEGSLFSASFLLVTSLTTLVLWLRAFLPLARVAASVAALALIVGGGPWGDVEEAEYVGLLLRAGGAVLLVLVALTVLWQERPSRAPLPAPIAIGLVVFLVPAITYGLLVLGYAEADAFPGAVVPALAVLALSLRVALADFPRRRGPGHEIGA